MPRDVDTRPDWLVYWRELRGRGAVCAAFPPSAEVERPVRTDRRADTRPDAVKAWVDELRRTGRCPEPLEAA